MAKFEYDPDRALNLHTQVRHALEIQEKRGALIIVGDRDRDRDSPLLWPDNPPPRHPSIIVAPPEPTRDPVKFDRFKESLVPGIIPDLSTQSTLPAAVSGGIDFGSLTYFNVPGFMWINNKLELRPSRWIEPDEQALHKLSRVTCKPIPELVRATVIRPFISFRLADFILNYEVGLAEGKNPYSDFFRSLAIGLTEQQLVKLKRDPPRFVRLLEIYLEQLKINPHLLEGPNLDLI